MQNICTADFVYKFQLLECGSIFPKCTLIAALNQIECFTLVRKGKVRAIIVIIQSTVKGILPPLWCR